MLIWQLIVQTTSGPAPIAATRSEPFCNLMVQLLGEIGQWAQCIAVIPGVGA